jgi:DNA-binding response OmpR family regulator
MLVEGTMAGGKILVVDDDGVLRASISRILEEEGYTVDSASDGQAALELVDSDPPDAILLDVMMPGMNGRQFLRELRSRSSLDIPVVVMTALHGLQDRAIEYGANDLVQKPFDVDELLNKVALALFRSGEYETITDRPAIPRPAAARASAPVAAAAQRRGVVLVVDEDRRTLEHIDQQLTSIGYTVVSLSRATDELPRLTRVLEARAVVLGLRGAADMAMESLRLVRADAALREVPVLVFAGRADDDVEPHRAEIEGLGGQAIARPIGESGNSSRSPASRWRARRPAAPARAFRACPTPES